MKLGVHIGYWGLGLTPEDQLEIVREAERLGYDSVWAAEAYGSDAATILGWIAGQTEKIKIGSAIFQMPARSPAMTAMTAATLDQLSGGRMLLGIGSSGPPGAQGRHRQPLPPPPQRTRGDGAGVRQGRHPEGGAVPGATPASCSARASTSRSCARCSTASASSSTARRSSCRSPTGRARR